MTKLKILVILGSTRKGRYGEKPAHWLHSRLAANPDLDCELVDLRDWPLPFYEAATPPARVHDGNYGEPLVNKWAEKIGSADGFVLTAAEYNHGYTAVLKNALDWIYREWNRKPVTFLGYGFGAGGSRAVEQLRQVAIELQMAPIRNAVFIPREVFMATMKEPAPVDPSHFATLEPSVKAMSDELIWWARALREARTQKSAT